MTIIIDNNKIIIIVVITINEKTTNHSQHLEPNAVKFFMLRVSITLHNFEYSTQCNDKSAETL